jgi:hypothetical protein
MTQRWLIPLLPLVAFLGATSSANAQASRRCLGADSIPAAVRPFVALRSCALTVQHADLDRDGRADYLLVLERQDTVPEDGHLRALLVLVAAEGGRLRLAAQSNRAVMCSRCGGVWGDPFDTLEVGPGTFTVHHFGGAGWRWRTEYRFNYSRRDRAWQLVRATEVEFHSGDPENTLKMQVYTPPRHFGKIDLRAFDPRHYRGRGAR